MNSTADTPFERASRIWDERIGSARAQAFRWQLAAVGALLVAAIAVIGVIVQSQKAQVVAYVVEVDIHGEPRVVTQALQPYVPKQALYEWQAREFITNLRMLSTDARLVQANWIKAYHVLTPKGQNLFRALAHEEPRYNDVGRKIIDIQVTRIVPASDTTLDITWTETIRDMYGQTVETKPYSGLVTVVLREPRTDEEIKQNPLGIWIDHFSWQGKDY